jgi:aryl-alcohol dehydrogenase
VDVQDHHPGSSIPQQFIPRLVTLWEQGRFPIDEMIRNYKLDDVNLAFSDSASGETVKPIVVY